MPRKFCSFVKLIFWGILNIPKENSSQCRGIKKIYSLSYRARIMELHVSFFYSYISTITSITFSAMLLSLKGIFSKYNWSKALQREGLKVMLKKWKNWDICNMHTYIIYHGQIFKNNSRSKRDLSLHYYSIPCNLALLMSPEYLYIYIYTGAYLSL